MKILYISDPYPNRRHNSRGAFSYKYVQVLVKQGHEVTVYSPDNLWKSGLMRKRSSYGDEGARRVYRPRYVSFGAFKLLGFNSYYLTHLQKKFWLRKCFNKNEYYDLVISQFISSALYYLDYIGDVRANVIIDVGENRGITRTMSWYSKDKYFSLIKKATSWIAVSDDVKNTLLENRVCNKVNVLHNGVHLNDYTSLLKYRNSYRKAFKVSDDTIMGIYVGRFVKDKGYEDLLKAATGKSVSWVFLGGQDPHGQAHLDTVYSGSVAPNEVIQYLVAADFFVLPTYHEGASNSIVEAMAAELPIIATNIPSIVEQTMGLCGPLISPGDIPALSKAIDTMCVKENRIRYAQSSKERSSLFSADYRMSKLIEYGKNNS